MFRLLVVLCCLLSINSQLLEEQHPAPEPYSFAFSSPNEDGTSSSREETGDASGRITGSYTILGADGQQRRVEYVADENGFRANVITNEIGTESQNSADVQYQSSAPTAAELTAQWEASGAGRARLQAAVPIAPVPVAPIAPIAPLTRPVGPIRGSGLVASPIGPIGGGFTGTQALRFNQGARIAAPLPRPVSRIARPQVPIVAPIAPQIPVPVAPVVSPLPAPFVAPGGAIRGQGAGFAKAQSFGAIAGGFTGSQTPFGFRVSPVNLGQFGVGLTPVGVSAAPFQSFQSPYGDARGLTFSNYPLNGNGGQFGANFLLLPSNALNGQPAHQHQHESGQSATNVITQKAETKEEDYGRKSK